LAFGRDDIGAHLARRRHRAERHDLAHHGDQQRALGMAGGRERRQIAQAAEHVRILHHQAGGRIIDQGGEIAGLFRIRLVAHHLGVGETGNGAHRVAVMRVQRTRQHDAVALGDAPRHEHRFRRGGGAVIHRGIGDLHAGDQRLVKFEQITAMPSFPFDGRIGVKLAADRMIDRRRLRW
jgi:hypothetical protein